MIVANPDRVAEDLRRQMPVAEVPRDTHELRRVPAMNIDDALRFGFHEYRAAVAQGQSIAVG